MVTVPVRNLDLDAVASSGQCFRWQRRGGGWRIAAGGSLVHIRQDREAGTVTLDCTPEEFEALWRGYLDLDTDYAAILRSIPPEDEYLTAAGRCGSGIRILRQDPWETLITFLISQRKNIPAIRLSVERLCAAAGMPLAREDGETVRAFPSPEELSRLAMEELAACSLGYRAGYIRAAALKCSEGGCDLGSLAALDNAGLEAALREFYGVGVKIARCVMLFGYHRLDVFPEDVWIRRVRERRYPGGIPAEHGSPWAGVMQQYMFAYERSLSGVRDSVIPSAGPDGGSRF